MPYLTQDRRNLLRQGQAPLTGGDLNYLVSLFYSDYLTEETLTYSAINQLLGSTRLLMLDLNEFFAGGCFPDAKSSNRVYTTLLQIVKRMLNAAPEHVGLDAEVMGGLEGAIQELYRRVASWYESSKLVKNGDVYNHILVNDEKARG